MAELAARRSARRRNDSGRRSLCGEESPSRSSTARSRAERGRLEEQRLAAVEQRIDADLELGRQAELVPELERLVASTRFASGSAGS